jgi:hypothetical protein
MPYASRKNKPRTNIWATRQSWNRYAYVLNNPLGFTDPLGLTCKWDDGTVDWTGESEEGDDQNACESAGGTWVPAASGATTVEVIASPDDYSQTIVVWIDPSGLTFSNGSGGGGGAGWGGNIQSTLYNFAHPTRQTCTRINKKAKIELATAAVSAAGGFLFPPIAVVSEPVALATGLVGAGEELYMAYMCEN